MYPVIADPPVAGAIHVAVTDVESGFVTVGLAGVDGTDTGVASEKLVDWLKPSAFFAFTVKL